MSLINEALRKARQAASEHDSKQADGPFQPPKAYPSRSSGRRSGLLTMVLIAVFAGVVGAAVAWWTLGGRQESSQAGFATEGAPEAVITEEPAPDLFPTPAEAPDTNEATAPPVVTAPTPIADRTAESAAETQPLAEPVAAESAPQATTDRGTAASDGDRVFVMEAELGEVTLSLGFIVARPNNPFAEINGIEVYVGSEIEGFVVEAIEADRVTLRDDQGPLVLRVP